MSNPESAFAPLRLPFAFSLALFSLLCACNRAPSPQASSAPTNAAATAESIEELSARLDVTVWKDEVLGQRYERTFVQLADRFRASSNKIAVLADLPFDSIVLPKLRGSPAQLGLNIVQQLFAPGTNAMPYAAWRETLLTLSSNGWKLDSAEWYHEKFIPPASGSNAWSEMSFELFGHRLAGRVRFIMKGTLAVHWDVTAPDQHRPKRLTVTDLTVLEREGLPGFTRHAVVTPEPPERYGDMVNMHPIIVTDINQDGSDDVIMSGVNQVFLNDGTATFKPAEFVSEAVFRGSTDAGVVADFNGDALLDFITVAKKDTLTNKVVIYPGNGSVPLTIAPIVAWPEGKVLAPSAITAADIDGDGDLDLWIGQYKPPYKGGQLPTPFYDANDGLPAALLLNDGRANFQQVTAGRGLNAKRFRRTLAASFADVDGDHDMDLLTVNDYAGVDLYYNDGSGHFTDETARLYNRHLFGMGHCFADFDRDGALDFLAIGMSVPTVRRLEFMKLGWDQYPDRTAKRAEMAYGNRVYVLRSGKWVQPGWGDQLARTGWSWGTTAFDFDNNGMVDVYVANGHISGQSGEDYDSHIWTHDIYVGSSREDPALLRYFDKPFRGINTGKTSSNGFQHDVLFMDTGTNNFVNVAYLMDVAHDQDCRAVVSADLNSDGRQDLILTEGQWFNGPATGRNRLWIHLNRLQTANHWIGVRLRSRQPGLSPIGAKVWADAEDQTFVAQVVTGDSYQSQHPNAVHFGLGKREKLRSVRVRWPNGETNTITAPALDRYHTVER